MYGGGGDDADPNSGFDLSPAANAPASHYTPELGLSGAIEGTVTWRGAPPPPLVTACGAVDAPGAHVAANRAMAGVLVYIEHVEVGPALPTLGRPARVGGM